MDSQVGALSIWQLHCDAVAFTAIHQDWGSKPGSAFFVYEAAGAGPVKCLLVNQLDSLISSLKLCRCLCDGWLCIAGFSRVVRSIYYH